MNLNQPEFPLLKTVSPQELEQRLEEYATFTKISNNVRYIGFAVFALIGIYNFSVAGKRYTRAERDTIEITIVSAGALVIAILIWFLVSILKKQSALKKGLRATVGKRQLDKVAFLKEYNRLVIAHYGGKGVKKI